MLSNGLHQFGVALTDDQGNTTFIPRSSAYGMNVNVQN
jgi:hypothetical protein